MNLKKLKSNVKSDSKIFLNNSNYSQIDRQLLSISSLEKLYLMERAIFSCSNSIIIVDANRPNFPIIFVNPAFQHLTGYTPDEVLGRNCQFLQGNDINQPEIQQIKTALLQKKECHVVLRNYRKDGTLFWNELYICPVFNENNLLTHFIGSQNDVTKQKRLEIERIQIKQALLASQERLNGILDIAKDAIISVDVNQTIQLFNQKAENIFGYQTEEILGQPLKLILPYFQECSLHQEHCCPIGQSLKIYALRKDGTPFLAEADICELQLKERKICTLILRDISDRQLAEEQIQRYGFYDSLTNLPNRKYFMQKLEQGLNSLGSKDLCVVLFVDLDDFKLVNDSLGHEIGDLLLTACAQRIQNCLSTEDLVARFGGDEFLILLPNIKDIYYAVEVSQRIHQQIQLPFQLDDYQVFINASIGISLGTYGCCKPKELLRNADIAMYHAKAKGKGNYAVFDRQMHKQAMARLQIETDLRQASLHEEFELYYQPIVSLITGKTIALEALVRWNHPQRGMISPGEFISVAEETGLIVSLGQWVLQEACTQMKAWHQQFPQITPLTISVNISAKQLQQNHFLEQLDQILTLTGLDPNYLKLEITESVLIENTEYFEKTLINIRQKKIQLSLDDFGTGFSSLSYLQRFPISTVKIDRSFVHSVISNNKNAAIIGAIVNLARILDMDTIAEGIETLSQLEPLRLLGCSLAQGYFFSRPLPVKDVQVFLQKHGSPRTGQLKQVEK